MQVALISDIHGNLVALDAVLDAIHREDPDRIVCLGDVAHEGPEPIAVLERVRDLDCPVITGNGEEWLRSVGSPDRYRNKPQVAHDIVEWVADQMGPADERFIASFRETIEMELGEDLELMCYHGSPQSPREHLWVDADESVLERAIEASDADVFVGGHTHVQMVRRFHDRTFVNTGSVGVAMERTAAGDIRYPPRAEWATVTAEGGSVSIALNRTPVDVESVRDAVRRSDMPHPERWLDRY